MSWIWRTRPVRARTPSSAGDGAADPGAVRLHLEKILTSPEFASATRLQQFLAFVVEERLQGADTIKETDLAIRVFNRRTSFDPSGDSVVRVAAGNLRHRLRDYYLNTGRDDPLLIELPKGTYVPVFRTRSASMPGPARARIRPVWWIVASAFELVLIGAVLYWLLAPPRRTWSSIAVLPFLNLSNNPDSEYMTDGLVEEVTTALAQVEGLQVVARSSAFQFRGKGLDIRAAGRQLGVETVLEGSVRTVGNKVRISAQLIKVADGFHIWSRTWEGDPNDIFAIQDDLTRSVAAALKRRQPQRAAAPRDLEAYDLYLKGQYFKDRITSADLARSVHYLQQSIRKDPTYAPAHSVLADAYASTAYHEVVPDPEAIARAKSEAQRALALDPSLAEAHALLAWIRFFYDWDWPESERGLRRALALNPNSARAHDWYAQWLTSAGRFDEALSEARKALTLDPLNCRVVTNVAVVFYCARRYDEAYRQTRQALEINPHYYQAHTIGGASLQEKRMYAEAEAEMQAAMNEYRGDPDTVAHLAVVQMALGHRADAVETIAAFEHPPVGQPVAHYELAYLYLAMGQKDRALDALAKAYGERSSDMLVLNVDPVFAGLHTDPRFVALRSKMGWTR
jgi:TolB-like protein/Flp pilus assembly protein TadD